MLILGQDDNEKLLGKVLHELGTEVQWNTTLMELAQTPEGVAASLQQADGSIRQLTAKWVAGCDGAHSTVRSLCGIPFSGGPYQHVFYVADTHATGPMAPDELNVFLWRGGFHLFFPMRGTDHWRVVGIVPPELLSHAEQGFDALAPYIRRDLELAEADDGLRFHDCSWYSTYHVHHRRADRFRAGRCFLLGDAAHIHSPVGAQGMNTGLQDAYNLAWKLALVISENADGSLLDTYEIERLPVAQRLLATTDQAFTFLISERWAAQVFRTQIVQRIIALAMRRDRTRKLAFRTISQTGIRYRHSPLSRMLTAFPETAPIAGDRFPWLRLALTDGGPLEDLFQRRDDTRFTLIVLGQPALALTADMPARHAALMTTWIVPQDPRNDEALMRARIPTPSFYLLRPDGHVGLAGTLLDPAAIAGYFADLLKPGAPAAA